MLGNMLEKGGSVLGPKEPEGWDLLSTAEFIICDVVAMPKTHIYNPAVISQKRCFKLLDRGSGHISLYSTSIKQPVTRSNFEKVAVALEQEGACSER